MEQLMDFIGLTDTEEIKLLSLNSANSSVLKQNCQSSYSDLNTTTITVVQYHYHVLINFCLKGHK